MSVLAVDIGGTKLAAALVSESGEVTGQREVPTPPSSLGEAHLAGELARLVTAVYDGSATVAAIASAGPLDVDRGTISPVNIAAWRDFDVVACVRKATGLEPLLVGDAAAAAIGEQWIGAGSGSRALLGIVVSTGIGGGLVLDGRPYPGPTGNAGHIGHIVVDPDGPPCICGARGCVETISSGPSTLAWARSQGWRGDSMPELAVAAGAGDPLAVAAFERAAEALGRGIAISAALCDLDTVVIGGGVAAAGETLLEPLRRRTAEHTKLTYTQQVRIVQARLGRRAGLIGAARHALRSNAAPRAGTTP